MPIKETSDDPTQGVLAEPHIVVPPSRRGPADYLAVAVATCGVGLIPVAPGTWGAGLGVLLFLLLRGAVLRAAASAGRGAEWGASVHTSLLLLLVVGVTLAGVWGATRSERLFGRKDPGAVVVDEVSGQLITYLFIPAGAGVWAVAAGFVLFRLFDIWKPYPIRRLEALPSGLGVMADDVLAGAYAAVVLSLLWTASVLL